jgi:hypothetical protein
MYNAQQQALFQQTNQQLISIRQLEINYYTNINVAIGTQAALIGGFAYGVFTQNQAGDFTYADEFHTVYYILSAVTIASAVHVIVNTMMLQVMGPGLSLNGPVGSMAKAAEGMKAELPQVSYAFALMMISFSLSTMLSFWVVMDLLAAILSTLVFVVAARCWYYYCSRVYYRLYWNPTDEWQNNRDSEDFDIHAASKNPLQTTTNTDNNNNNNVADDGRSLNESTDNHSTYNNFNHNNNSSRISRWSKAFGVGNKDQGRDNDTPVDLRQALVDLPVAVRCEGYFLKKAGDHHKLDASTSSPASKYFGSASGNWERCYFVLFTNGFLYYYKSRQEFKQDPKRYLKRPLEMVDFKVLVTNSVSAVGVEDDKTSVKSGRTAMSGKGNGGSGGIKVVCQLDLFPRDNSTTHWSLRCDTEEELLSWEDALRDVSPTSFDPVTD